MKNIWAYNSSFAFVSMSLTGKEYVFKSRGPYCFRINGQVYHTISQLLPQETLLSSVRSIGQIALAVTSSGIGAELLEGGRTAHSQFKIPIPISDESMCSISLQLSHAELIKCTSLICWDEVLMSSKQHIECVNRSLRDIMKVDKPFGGITILFGGDP